MNNETAEALDASIDKWEGYLTEDNPDNIMMGVKECPLCKLFFFSDNPCVGCPIDKKTGNGCNYTPFHRASNRLHRWHSRVLYVGFEGLVEDETVKFTREDFCDAVQDELELLNSLK